MRRFFFPFFVLPRLKGLEINHRFLFGRAGLCLSALALRLISPSLICLAVVEPTTSLCPLLSPSLPHVIAKSLSLSLPLSLGGVHSLTRSRRQFPA